MKRTRIAAVIAVTLLSTAAACSTETPATPVTVTVTPTVIVTDTATSTGGTETATAQQGEGQMGDPTDADRAAALKGATAFAAVWVQGQSLPQDTWMKQLMATAAPGQGQELLSTVLGNNVEATAIKGTPTLDEITPSSAVVIVQTNREPLQITLTATAAQIYKVSRVDIGTQ